MSCKFKMAPNQLYDNGDTSFHSHVPKALQQPKASSESSEKE